MAHTSTKLVAKNIFVDTVDDDSRPGVANASSANKGLRRAIQAAKAAVEKLEQKYPFLLQLHKNLCHRLN